MKCVKKMLFIISYFFTNNTDKNSWQYTWTIKYTNVVIVLKLVWFNFRDLLLHKFHGPKVKRPIVLLFSSTNWARNANFAYIINLCLIDRYSIKIPIATFIFLIYFKMTENLRTYEVQVKYWSYEDRIVHCVHVTP